MGVGACMEKTFEHRNPTKPQDHQNGGKGTYIEVGACMGLPVW